MKVNRYFPGFNTLRFVAAVAVIIHHIEQFKGSLGLNNIWMNPWVYGMGKSAVSLFFVLSGFLITYLLLEEHQQTQTIHIGRFYGRRILRIWPLYYLIVAWAFWGLPLLLPIAFNGMGDVQNDFAGKLLLFLLILPNVALAAYPAVVGASQAWSIGVEEQFYLIWPLLMRLCINHLWFLFGAVIAIREGVLVSLNFVALNPAFLHLSAQAITQVGFIRDVWASMQFEYMALGGAMALLEFRGQFRKMTFFSQKPIQIAIGIGILTLIAQRDFWGHDLIEATLFALLIANVAIQPQLWSAIENRFFNFMGKTSYGLYMYHPTLIVLALVGLRASPELLTHQRTFNGLLYGIVIIGTFSIAALSYLFFEKPFLNLKARLKPAPVPIESQLPK
jgi:peptidoglycan/LPS O-acetylase OafA/YrhL